MRTRSALYLIIALVFSSVSAAAETRLDQLFARVLADSETKHRLGKPLTDRKQSPIRSFSQIASNTIDAELVPDGIVAVKLLQDPQTGKKGIAIEIGFINGRISFVSLDGNTVATFLHDGTLPEPYAALKKDPEGATEHFEAVIGEIERYFDRIAPI